MRILVCGGRTYSGLMTDPILRDYLPKGTLNTDGLTPVIIHGGADGADHHAYEWAIKHQCLTQTFKPDWQLGPQAGPLRNQQMIDEGKPDICVAFPGGRGTADMVRRCKAASIPVREIPN